MVVWPSTWFMVYDGQSHRRQALYSGSYIIGSSMFIPSSYTPGCALLVLLSLRLNEGRSAGIAFGQLFI